MMAVNDSYKQKRRPLKSLLAASLIFALGWAAGNHRWPIGTGPDRLPAQNTQLPPDLNYNGVEQVYDTLKRRFDGQLKAADLIDGLKSGLVRATGDPYTEYLNPEQARQLDNDLNGTFSGIGAELGKDKNTIVIIAPIAGYPAEKAGLRPRDQIIEINDQSAYDLTIGDAVSKIRGPEGTQVRLKLLRGGQEINVEITRRQITVPSVEASILPGNIGELKISRFSEDTAKLARQAAERFQAAAVRAVILDLRGDPGGLLDASVEVSGLWLERGKTVLEERRGGQLIKTYASTGPALLKAIPLAILINEGSASASEITAGALKDNGIGRLIGQKSFGKGSVQQLERLEDGGVLKVTIARWYTPKGRNIDKEGILPDDKVERSAEDYREGRDPQKEAAVRFLKTQLP